MAIAAWEVLKCLIDGYVMGRSGWWESLRDVRVRSVFVREREKAGWGMVGQTGQILQVMQKIHAGFFNADWCGESLDLAFLPPFRPTD